MNIKKLIFASIAVTLSGVILYVFAHPSQTSFLTPNEWWHYSGNINISWNAATNADTYSIYLTDPWNNTTAVIEGATSTGTILDSTSKSWTYILTWKSCNSTGCTNFDTWINFIIDNTKPTWTIAYTPNTLTNTNVIATITLSETWNITNNNNQTSYTFTGNGSFTFEFQDLAGNTWEETATVDWIDKTPITPTVVYSPSTNTNQNVTITITFDKTWVTITNNSGNNEYIFTWNWNFTFEFQDLAGNTWEETATVYWIDKTPVTWTVNYSTTGATNQPVTATIIFNKTWVTIINNSGNNDYIFTWNWNFTFEFFDSYGNTWNSTATVDWIDLIPPTCNVFYSTTWMTNQDVIAILTWCDETIIAHTTEYTFTGNGSFTFEFQDLAGNTWSNVATVTRIDKSLPIVEQAFIYSWNTNTWNNWSWFYNGTISIKSQVYTNSGSSWISGSSCKYTLTWTNRYSANYDSTWWYCYVDYLNPKTDIDIIFSVSNDVWSTWTWESKQYFYDITSPTTTDDANSDWRNTDLTVTLTATDTWAWVSHTLYYTWTDTSCTPTIIWTSATVTCPTNSVCTGLYVRYRSVDLVWNMEENIQTSPEIRIDKELPYITWTTSITSSNSNGSFAKVGDTVSITFTSHEDLSENPTVKINSWWYMDFVSKITWSNTYTYERSMDSSDPEWIISINISMKDIAGNTWNYILTSNITYDRTPPSWISITEPNYSSYRQSQTWTAYREIKRNTWTEQNFWPTSLRIEYSNNNFQWWWVHTIITTWTSNNWVFHRTVNSDDTSSAQIRIIATDLAGNTRTFTSSSFKIDSIPPTGPTFIYPLWSGELFKWGNQINIQWTWWRDANLDKKILEFSINEGSSRTVLATLWDAAFSYIRTPWNINSNKVRLWIKYQDKWGLTSPYTQTQNFTIDSTPPTPIVFIDSNSNRRNTNAIATWTSSDELAWLRNTGILYKTDWPFTTNCDGWSSTIPVFTTDWIHTWYACVMDKVWNIRTWQQVYKIDKTAPIVHMPAPIITNTWKTININVNWDVSWIQSYKWSKISGSWTITFSTGTHVKDPFVTADTDWHYVLQVVVKDKATNTTTWTIEFFWNATAPIITTWTITNTSSKTPTFTFTATDSGTLHWSWPCSSSTTTAVSGNNQITLSTLANNTYNNCYVRIIDTMNNTWVWYNLPSFTVSYNPPSWWGGGGGGWWWGGWGFSIPTCTTQDLTCGIYGKYVLKSWVTCKWWDLWKTCGTDICVDWDYSWDPNDWICHDPTKVEANSWLAQSGTRETFKSPYNKELTDAYSYAFGVKITTVPNIERADLTGILIRSHLSKMMSEYAMKVLWKTPDTSRKCIFKDVDNQTDEFKKYARISCELWLMWLKTDWTPADTFDPDGKVTRAIFGTTLSRAIWWDKNNWWSNRYAKHLADLKAHWIMNQIDFPNNRELRWRVMLTMMRADQKLKQSKYSKFESLWNKKIFVPAKTKATKPSTNNNAENKITEKYSSSDKEFINWTIKNYQFYEWYTIWQSKLWVKYLQYFLKEQDYYTWSIDWINNTATVSALLEFQLKHKLITDSNDMARWFLWPSTRAVINPLLKEILNK